MLAGIRVPRLGAGRPRTTPDAVIADRAYSSGVTRRMLAIRGNKAVVPQKKGREGRPPPQGCTGRATSPP